MTKTRLKHRFSTRRVDYYIYRGTSWFQVKHRLEENMQSQSIEVDEEIYFLHLFMSWKHNLDNMVSDNRNKKKQKSPEVLPDTYTLHESKTFLVYFSLSDIFRIIYFCRRHFNLTGVRKTCREVWSWEPCVRYDRWLVCFYFSSSHVSNHSPLILGYIANKPQELHWGVRAASRWPLGHFHQRSHWPQSRAQHGHRRSSAARPTALEGSRNRTASHIFVIWLIVKFYMSGFSGRY